MHVGGGGENTAGNQRKHTAPLRFRTPQIPHGVPTDRPGFRIRYENHQEAGDGLSTQVWPRQSADGRPQYQVNKSRGPQSASASSLPFFNQRIHSIWHSIITLTCFCAHAPSSGSLVAASRIFKTKEPVRFVTNANYNLLKTLWHTLERGACRYKQDISKLVSQSGWWWRSGLKWLRTGQKGRVCAIVLINLMVPE
jgi:hypothetical protein